MQGAGMKKAAAFFLCLGVTALAGRAETKNYFFPEVRIEVSIARDGGFVVDEYRTYEFRGPFSWADLAIPLAVTRHGRRSEARLSDFEVSDERGRALESETRFGGDRFEAKWHYSARNERRTFHIHYRIDGGIRSYPDVTELYWQVIGDGWAKPTRKVVVEARLPEALSDRNALKVWGHGPLTGWAEIVDERTARFSADNVPSGQYVEIRMLWPAGLVAGVPSSGESLESITQEEAGFVRDTIERVRRAAVQEQEAKRKWLKILAVWGGWQLVGPLIWLLVYFRFWPRIGKDHRFEGLPEYYRELPSDLKPALVQVLMREGREVTPAAFTATIFDLARRGFLRMEDRKVEKKSLFGSREHEETRLTLSKDFDTDASLRDYEKDLLVLLFSRLGEAGMSKGSSFTLDDLKEYLRKKAQEFQKWYGSWTKSIKEEARPLGFLEPESLKARNLFLAVSLPVGILTLSPVLLILSGVLIPTLKRRTMAWARENELWKAFRHFLDDFSAFNELPPEALKLWEHYLVFGVLFGNARKILKALPVILRDERAAVPVWYAGASQAAFFTSGNLTGMIASIEHMATTVSQASLAAAHYSSGGGGGFSGGGGAGGGGGGGGAG